MRRVLGLEFFFWNFFFGEFGSFLTFFFFHLFVLFLLGHLLVGGLLGLGFDRQALEQHRLVLRYVLMDMRVQQRATPLH